MAGFSLKFALRAALGVVLLALPEPAPGAYVPRPELPSLSPRILDYTIQVRLDPAERTLTGHQIVRWTNQTGTPATSIPLHLYLNAFRNNRSTFMRESEGSHRSSTLEKGEWGWIDIVDLRLLGGRDLLAAARFIQPDDGHPDDRTVLEVPLPEEVPPGGSVSLEIDFIARLPHAFARTGFKGDFFMVGQWYPKPGVFQGEAGWNCHQFHSNSEFFADFGRFDVAITVPQHYQVGATGQRHGQAVEHGDGSATYRFIQEDVHDFAWAADPGFLPRRRTFVAAEDQDPALTAAAAAALGYDVDDLGLGDVEITLLLQPEHAGQEERIFKALFAAINSYGLWYGRYPYGTLTVVDPQHGARGAGGMEYPTLITIGSDWLAPPALRSPESVTIHEFGHQYWYGLVASNEFEEPWLDEGLTTYSTGKVLEQAYGPALRATRFAGVPFLLHPPATLEPRPDRRPDGRRPTPGALHPPPSPWSWAEDHDGPSPLEWLLLHRLGMPDADLLTAFRDLPPLTYVPGVPVPVVEGYRANFLSGPGLDPVVRSAWEFLDRRSYALNSYRRPALVLRTLAGVVGEATMTRILRKYHERYRYRHPRSADFIRIAEEIAGRDLDWLLRPLLYSGEILDYAVESVSSEPIPSAEGIFGHGADRVLLGPGPPRPGQPPHGPPEDGTAGPGGEDADGRGYRNEVVVRRQGSVVVPVTVELEYDDGTTRRLRWDGVERWTRFVSDGSQRLVRATVDPDRIYVVDVSWLNNSRAVAADPRPPARWSLRVLLWMQTVLAFYGGLT